ncbi:unnamed protein product [Blepharisma stoltei]|uniref:Uncharacterized protein n=1 Tax=Blepharisma stoltei TaxID=1481888 RepID=A0AAU9IJZ7_9CILI|nr:unnamed protein product [Blepharisma stoltei]
MEKRMLSEGFSCRMHQEILSSNEVPNLFGNSNAMKMHYANYQRNLRNYLIQPVSYFRQYFLHYFSTKTHLSYQIPNFYKKVFYLSTVLMMSEVEIIYWLLIIESISASKIISNPELMLAISGLRAKIDLNENSGIFTFILCCIVPEFIVSFRYFWNVELETINISAKDLNNKYNELICRDIKVEEKVDYNEIVDEIIQSNQNGFKNIPKEVYNQEELLNDLEKQLIFELESIKNENFLINNS